MKKIVSYAVVFMMTLMILWVPSCEMYAASLSMSVSKSSVNIGDTVTVTVSVSSGVTATVDVYFPTDLFAFSGASGTANANGGTVSATLGSPFASSVTVTLKAKTSGTGTISAKAVKAGDSNTGEEITLGGTSKSVTIENKVEEPPTPPISSEPPTTPEEPTPPSESTTPSEPTTPERPVETPKSGDNSLSLLKLSKGKLSPAFKSSVTSYTATVENDVKSIAITAVPTHDKAVVDSVTGNGKVALSVGSNTINIVVRAENGVKATYKVVVTRKSAENDEPVSESENAPNSENNSQTTEIQQPKPIEFEYNGQKLNIIEEISNETIPTDFVKGKLVIDGTEIPSLTFSKGDLSVLYLMNPSKYGALYTYNKKEQNIYPFIKLISEKTYVIILQPTDIEAPDGYSPCTLSIEGKGNIEAYRMEDQASDFYLIYCINNKGEKGWYQYEYTESTFQRYTGTFLSNANTEIVEGEGEDDLQKKYNKAIEELNKSKSTQKMLFGVIVVLAVVLVGTIIAIIRLSKKDKDDDSYKGDSFEDSIEDTNTDISENIANEIATDLEEQKFEDEVEVEFYEMQTDENEQDKTDDVSDEELEIEFYELSEELGNFEQSEQTPTSENTQVITELGSNKQLQAGLEELKNEKKSEEDSDDDLEFIDL